MSLRRVAISALLWAVVTGPLGPRSAAWQDSPPTFRGGVQLIEVDVVATGRDGKSVRDLTRDDFEIIEGNRQQQIRTFTLIDLPVERPPKSKPATPSPEPDVVGNSVPEGRTYVLVLDAPGNLRARHLAERWLDEVVQPHDRVAVVHPQGTFSDAQPFTNSRRLILDSINRMIWGAGGGADVRPPGTRMIDGLRAVQEISERLATIGGRRKAVVWFGADINLHPQSGLKPGQGALEDPIAKVGDALLLAWRDASRAAVNNNVAIYPVDPSGLTTDLGLGELVRQASFREVAEETGGVAIGVNTNSFSEGYATVVQDASTYYLLGYAPEPEPIDGKFHPIQVRVNREGVTVRARRGYYARDVNAPPPKPLPAPPEGVSLAARDALRKPVATPGLGIDVTATAFRGNGKDASVVITAHVRGSTLEFDAGRRLALSYQVFDLEGKVATGLLQGLRIQPGQRQQGPRNGDRSAVRRARVTQARKIRAAACR